MRIGHYEPTTVVVLEDGLISPAFESEELRRYHGFPGMTDEDLFCLTFHEFSRSVKVALLDEGPLTPRRVYDCGAAVYERAGQERQARSRERGKRRRAMDEYKWFCEKLYRDWYEDQLRIPEGFRFQEKYAPEPYLTFYGESLKASGEPKLIFLTTNPGDGMRLQTKAQIEALVTDDSYDVVQARLAGVYAEHHVPGTKRTISVPAKTRIKRMKEIASELHQRNLISNTGFIQCEAVPFHSESLPNKRKLTRLLQSVGGESVLTGYLEALSVLLRANHVVALDATKKLKNEATLWTDWIAMKASLFDFEPSKAPDPYEKLSLNGNPSVRFYGYRENGLVRAYNLTDAGNNFGKEVVKMVAAIKGDGPL